MDFDAFGAWLGTTPLYVSGAILLTLITTAFLLGRLARRKYPAETLDGDNLLTSSVLALLGLLLSFTLFLASERYEARRILVQEEANAIGTMYLRAQLLEEPHRSSISRTLLDYTDNRIALAQAAPGHGQEQLAVNDRLLRQFWAQSAAAFPSIRGLDFSSTFYDSVNRLIDLDATRKSARMTRVPRVLFVLIVVYVSASAIMLGFFSSTPVGVGRSSLLLFLLVLFVLVIVDIDQPTTGSIREAQGPMERMRASLAPPG